MLRNVGIGLLLALALGCGGATQGPGGAAPDGEAEPGSASAGGGGAAAAPAPAGEGVVFTPRAPQVGTVIVTQRKSESRLELSQRRGKKPVTVVQGTSQRVETRTKVLRATEAAVVKKRVEYLEGSSEQRIGNRTQRVPNPLIGKTYILMARGDDLFITDREGGEVSDYEREQLEREHSNLGQPSPFAALMPAEAIAPGTNLEVDPKALVRAFGSDDVDVRAAEFVLESLAQRDGVTVGRFRVSLTLVETTQETVRETELGGFVLLRADTCWPVETQMSGTLKLTGRPPNPSELRGNGEVTMQVHTSYETDGG